MRGRFTASNKLIVPQDLLAIHGRDCVFVRPLAYVQTKSAAIPTQVDAKLKQTGARTTRVAHRVNTVP